ncbi:hypothetical protein PCANB_000655 [Pneumocystis canis]|nr:hypothetical protein PCANB_000655 [Pneumocystis canis]
MFCETNEKDDNLHNLIILVIDTNFIISHLSLISELSQQCETYNYIILFPWVTIQELNGLKSLENTYLSNNDTAFLVRKATDFIYHSLSQKGNLIRGQKMTEVLDPSLTGDDSILDCCRYWHEKRLFKTILLSNDKNLAIKSISYKPGMTLNSLISEISKKLDYYSKCKDFDENPQIIDMEIDDIHESSSESSKFPEYTRLSYMEQDDISENDIFKAEKIHDDDNFLKDAPFPDSCRPFLMEFLKDITSTILETSETLLKKHMARFLGNDFSAEYLLKGCAFPPKRMEDLFQIIQKFWTTIFKELFKSHAYEGIIWAILGIGIGPSSGQELKDWVEDIIIFWTLLATGSVTDETGDEMAKRQQVIELWRTKVKCLQRHF